MKYIIPISVFSIQLLTFFFSLTGTAQMISSDTSMSGNSWLDSHQTLMSYLDESVAKLAPEKYITQRKRRNEFHRRAFTGILFDGANNDGAAALFGYFKLELNMDYALEYLHRTFYVGGWPLPDNFGLPSDPWKKEWWSYR